MFFSLNLFDMQYPNWVLKHKSKNTEIRSIANKYYLYKISSKWDPIKKRPKKITVAYLGRIHQDGLIPAKKRTCNNNKNNISLQHTYALEYGASYILYNIGKDILDNLRKYIGDDGELIFIIAIIRLIENCSLRQINQLYLNSFLSISNPNLSLGPNQITGLLRRVGLNRNKIITFFKHFISSDSHILFDATSITNSSKSLEINHLGYDSKRNFTNKINLLYMFSSENNEPSYFRIVPGNIREISAFKLCIKEIELKNVIVIADKGFTSSSNIEEMDSIGLQYILPLRRNDKKINYECFKPLELTSFDGYFTYKNRSIWHKSYLKEGKRIISYYDESLGHQERQDYLSRIEKGIEGYDLEKFHSKNHEFGSLSICSNISEDLNTETLYTYYKSRIEVEVMFDVLKNILDADKSYMRGEQELETWFLINHISILLYFRLITKFRDLGLLQKYCPQEILRYTKQIRKIKISQKWHTSEISSKIKTILKKCNLHIP